MKKVLLAIFLLLIVIFLYKRKNNSINKQESILQAQVDSLKEENDKKWDELKQLIVKQNLYKITEDSLLKILKIKPRWIKGMNRPIYYKDSTQKSVKPDIVYKDKIIHDTIFKPWKLVFSKDPQKVIADTLVVQETVRTNIFGNTTRILEVQAKHIPTNTVTSSKLIQLREKNEILGIGPYIGVTVNGKINYGISLQFPILKIKK